MPKKKVKRAAKRKPARRAAKSKKSRKAKPKPGQPGKVDTYNFLADKIPITINIYSKKGDFVPTYEVTIQAISENTEVILENIRKELVKQVNLGIVDITETKKSGMIEESFKTTIEILIKKYFPDADEETIEFLSGYLVQRSLGLGQIEILMHDESLEEIAINRADEPVWVYHRRHGWLRTTIILQNEDQIRHYAAMIGRRVGRQITILEPLMDANLSTGDRVNATLSPVSLKGNTITLRKFASKPWTITDFIAKGSVDTETAALVWLGVQYEMSMIIAGGTASGKTSMLNVVSNFFPPNQRIISIEDTHELQLPKFLHWIPLVTRLPNTEGKGGITMLDLLVNSLRMRPDRVVFGEIRRKAEAEVLFEAIHTGHSVYATFHANNVAEAITRLTSPPINVPTTMMPAISMIIVQYRNRRTGLRKTFQVAEILESGGASVLKQLDMKSGNLRNASRSKAVVKNLQLYTGLSPREISKDLKQKESILKWMVKNNINTVDSVGRVVAEYYTNLPNLLSYVRSNKPFE